ncbi:hypothetical protein B0H14DRAFT_3499017 [Mycena olivaceomarginata]|nr:hypothetical protein B0H14DRAFT_3499017 [Mycena olivaceomarginata]
MNPRTHADIMMLAPESDDATAHPFVYARILDLQNAVNVPGATTVPLPIEFLWVRWFRLDKTHVGGFKRKLLHQVEFVPDSEPGAYGFVNPDDDAPAPSFAQPEGELDDWNYHYVNFFVDRDMFMQYLGGGVGHYKVHVPDVEEDKPDVPDEMAPHPLGASAGDADKSESEDKSEDEEDDMDDEPESNQADEELMLGLEDGEDSIEDVTEDLGYAAL